MTKQTRRSFLHNTTVTAAGMTAASFSLLPGLSASAAMRPLPKAVAPPLPTRSSRSMVIHISDVAEGEITFLVGARETVVRDPGLVARLTETAHLAGLPNKSRPS